MGSDLPVVRRVRHLWRRVRRRTAAALTLAAVVVASIGVPLPAAMPKKASAERFPCESCPCGCSDAATCWRQCCCHTQTEKLAWAKRNGVRPPAFVVAAAAVEAREAKTQAATCGRCCSKCRQVAAMAKPVGGRIVLLVSALRCKGISIGVSLMPPSLPPAVAPTEFFADVQLAVPVEPPHLYLSPVYDVATPPPDARG